MKTKLLQNSALALAALTSYCPSAQAACPPTQEAESASDQDQSSNHQPCAKDLTLRGLLPDTAFQATGAPNMSALPSLPHFHVNSVRAPAEALGDDSIAIGGQAVSRQSNSVALGQSANANQRASTALGAFSRALATDSLALGHNARVYEDAHASVAIGHGAEVKAGASFAAAIGAFSDANAPNSVALGYSARANAENSVALGFLSVADEEDTVSVGRADRPDTSPDETIHRRITNVAPGVKASDAVNLAQLRKRDGLISQNSDRIDILSLELSNLPTVNEYISINGSGPLPSATGNNAIAIGSGAQAKGNGSAAIGLRAQSQFNNSFAFGANAQTSRDNQFVFGTALSNYQMKGLTSPGSRAAQAGVLELVTVDANGALAGDGGDTVRGLQGAIAENQDLISDNRRGISALETAVSRTREQAGETSERIEQNEAATAANRNEIQRNASAIVNNRVAIRKNLEEIELIKSDQAAGIAQIAEIETQVSNHESRIKTMDTELARQKTTVAANTRSIADLSSLAKENEQRIARSELAVTANADAISGLQTDFEQLGLSVNDLAAAFAQSNEQIETNTSGVAIANALAGSSWLQANESTALTLNASYFDGSSALAISGAQRLANKWSANFAIGTVPDRGELGARAGLRFGW